MPKWYGGSTLNPPGEYIPPDRQWVIQWQCCQRWYWRVVEVQKKAHKQEIQQDDIDTVIAFFQNVYHLKDWVLTSRPGLKDAINALFRDSFEMGACRDWFSPGFTDGLKKTVDRVAP